MSFHSYCHCRRQSAFNFKKRPLYLGGSLIIASRRLEAKPTEVALHKCRNAFCAILSLIVDHFIHRETVWSNDLQQESVIS